MPSQYGIIINDDTLDLIAVLNGGLRPGPEKKKKDRKRDRYFVFTAIPEEEITEDHEIVFEDDIWNDEGTMYVEKYEDITLMNG